MTDERRDDEILGRALARAIETIDVNQTPYERSRIATAPARRSIFVPTMAPSSSPGRSCGGSVRQASRRR